MVDGVTYAHGNPTRSWPLGPQVHCGSCNEQLEKFRHIYNHERPHRALNRRTPAAAEPPKAAPAGAKWGDHWRRHVDRVDRFGKLTLKHVLMLIHDAGVTISDATTGEIIRELTIDPCGITNQRTWAKKNTPVRRPGCYR